MKRYGVFALLLILVITVIGCRVDTEPLQNMPDFIGTISEVNPFNKQDAYGQILVEKKVDDYIDKYILTITKDSQLYEKIGDDLHSIDFDFLESQQQVQIWFSGPIMESFPMQGTAGQVVVTESAPPTHRQLAEYWAPVWWQDTDEDDFRADYITNIDFDGDWDTLNNWENFPNFELKAYIYYWVVETLTHWFIGYADYHPRDWSDDITAPLDQHENDMEGCLLVIKKAGGRFGQFVLVLTRAHEHFYSYKDYDDPVSKLVIDGNEDIDGDVEFDGHNLHIYVGAEGHAVYGDRRWEDKGFPSDDGVVYRYTGQAEEPENGNDRNVGYDLIYISDLWEKRNDIELFPEFGVFSGDNHGENKAHAPWRWDDKDDGKVRADQLFTDPAYLVEYYHDGLGDFSYIYVFQFR
ncbi:DUF3221 domain-containing protein [Chloroflexota bacterium]